MHLPSRSRSVGGTGGFLSLISLAAINFAVLICDRKPQPDYAEYPERGLGISVAPESFSEGFAACGGMSPTSEDNRPAPCCEGLTSNLDARIIIGPKGIKYGL